MPQLLHPPQPPPQEARLFTSSIFTGALTAVAAPATEAAVPDLPDQPVFDSSKVTVIFVLGGPGAGASSPNRGFKG